MTSLRLSGARFALCALVTTLTFTVPRAGTAAVATWTGAADGDWANDANWSAAHPDGINDTATFNSTTTNTTVSVGPVPKTVRQIIYQGATLGSYTIGGGTFLVPSTGAYNLVDRQNTVVADQIINANFELSATGSNNPQIRNNSATGRLVINGNFTSTGANARNMTLNGSNTGYTEFNGNFTATVGLVAMQVQNGTGVFAGTNTFSNLSTASSARLVINGTSASTAQIVINNTSVLGGTGSLTANVQLAPSGAGTILSPGDFTQPLEKQTGTLGISGNLSYNTNNAPGVFDFQIGGNTAGDGQGFYDQVNAGGSVSFIGASGNSATSLTLSLVNGYNPQEGDIFYLVTRGDGNPFTRTFTNFTEGQTFALGSGMAAITYQANWTGSEAGSNFTGGNDIAVKMVPEPAAITFLATGLAAFAMARRRHKEH